MGSLRQSLHMKTSLILLACLLVVALPEPRVPMAADPPVLTGLHLREDADSLLVLMMVDPHRPVPMATLPWNLKAALVDDLVVVVLVVVVLVVAHLEVALPEPRVLMTADPPVLTDLHPREGADLPVLMVDPP